MPKGKQIDRFRRQIEKKPVHILGSQAINLDEGQALAPLVSLIGDLSQRVLLASSLAVGDVAAVKETVGRASVLGQLKSGVAHYVDDSGNSHTLGELLMNNGSMLWGADLLKDPSLRRLLETRWQCQRGIFVVTQADAKEAKREFGSFRIPRARATIEVVRDFVAAEELLEEIVN